MKSIQNDSYESIEKGTGPIIELNDLGFLAFHPITASLLKSLIPELEDRSPEQIESMIDEITLLGQLSRDYDPFDQSRYFVKHCSQVSHDLEYVSLDITVRYKECPLVIFIQACCSENEEEIERMFKKTVEFVTQMTNEQLRSFIMRGCGGDLIPSYGFLISPNTSLYNGVDINMKQENLIGHAPNLIKNPAGKARLIGLQDNPEIDDHFDKARKQLKILFSQDLSPEQKLSKIKEETWN